MKPLLALLLLVFSAFAQEPDFLSSLFITSGAAEQIHIAELYICKDLKADDCRDGGAHTIFAILYPDQEKRGTLERDIKPSYQHWEIELPKGMTIQEAFNVLDDLGCGGKKPEWTLEHLVHAIERQFVQDPSSTWKLPKNAPAVLVYR